MQQKKTSYDSDVIIIGGGMAGLSSGIWCRRLGLSCIIFEENLDTGGQLHAIGFKIADYPGLVKNSKDFISQIQKQAFECGVSIHSSESIQNLNGINSTVQTDRQSYSGKAIILATGLKRRELSISTNDFTNIFYSVSLNIEKLKNKRILIVGGGDGAFEAAESLSGIAKSLTVSFRSSVPRAHVRFTQKAKSLNNIKFLPMTNLTAITSSSEAGGNNSAKTSGIWKAVLDGPGGNAVIEIDAVLVKIGYEPRNKLVKDQCRLDKKGYVITDQNQKTSSGRIWAAGDICNPKYPSLSAAGGQASIAVKNIASTVFI